MKYSEAFKSKMVRKLASPDDLYERPDNAFVAQFIGENNRLMGKVKGMNGRTCTVEVEGGEIEALAVNVDGAGENTLLSLRPERVAINPDGGSCANLFDAKVEEQIYLGDHMRTRVSLCGHDDFIIKVANSAGQVHLTPGEVVKVGWHAEDCRALDALPS